MQPIEKSTEPAAEWVPIGSLRPWADNPRKNDGAPVKKVAESIKRFGFASPIIARRENGEIIAGHTRWKAAQELGLDRVPVRYMDLDPADAKLLAIADNRVAEEAEWDEKILKKLLTDMNSSGVDLEVLGFDESELLDLLDIAGAPEGFGDGSGAISKPDELQAKWKTALGQLWRIESKSCPGMVHQIYCGDSTSPEAAAVAIGGAVADMMWTDPPYGVSYVGKTKDALEIKNDSLKESELQAFLEKCFAASPLKDGAAVYVAHPAGALSLQFRLAFDAVFRFRQGLVWLKDSMVLGRSDYHYKHEPIMYGNKPREAGRFGRGGEGWNGDNAQVSVFDVPRPKSSEEHPTMKPIDLVVAMIRNSSKPGDIVYEPFSGSGTTMLAAEACGRVCRSIELDPRFVAVALERFAELGMHGKLLEA